MDWSRAKFVLDRFESMSLMNLKELKQHIRRIQQLEEENDLESSQILELRTNLAEDYIDMFDTRIEPIRLQIQGMANTFNLIQRQKAAAASHDHSQSGSGTNMFDDCFSEEDGRNNSNSIYEQQLLTQATRNPKLEELKMEAQQRRMDAEASEKLAQDIDDLNQVMTDLAQLVHSQHELVDSIEEHVERSNQEVHSGHQQLKKAVANSNAKYPLMAAGVGSVVIGVQLDLQLVQLL
uniref:t-SNARE coiled-coil homology domain-containing protein n=1 Tax=Ditylenchus dipsaci TaxID=166011 RepID=A0A915DHM9_9BILA